MGLEQLGEARSVLSFHEDGSLFLTDGFGESVDRLYDIEIVEAGSVRVDDSSIDRFHTLFDAGSVFGHIDLSAVSDGQTIETNKDIKVTGTNAGDVYTVAQYNADVKLDIITGQEDDTITLGSNGEAHIIYTGGNDTYSGSYALTQSAQTYDELVHFSTLDITMDAGISVADVSISHHGDNAGNPFSTFLYQGSYTQATRLDLTLDVAGHGSIDLNYTHFTYGPAATRDLYFTLMFADGATRDIQWDDQAQLWTLIDGDAVSVSTSNEVIGIEGSETLFGGGSDDYILGLQGVDILIGQDGQDGIHGGAGDDHIYGGAGADTLVGGTGSDVIYIGHGDQIWGEAGADIFLIDQIEFGNTSDSAIIYDFNKDEDFISFEQIVAVHDEDDVAVYQNSSNDTVISFDTDTLVLKDVLLTDADLTGAFLFGDVQESSFDLPPVPLDVQDLNDDPYYDASSGGNLWANQLGNGEILNGGVGGDGLSGWDSTDYLYGNDGDDYLFGDAGDDVLFGGKGSDFLEGGSGNDFYVMSYNDYSAYAIDDIFDQGGVDIIQLTDGITLYDVGFGTGSGDAYISFYNADYDDYNSIRLIDQFAGNGENAIEYIQIEGITYDLNAIYSSWDFTPVAGGGVSQLVGPKAADDDITLDNLGKTITGSVFSDHGFGVDYNPYGYGLSVDPFTVSRAYGTFEVMSDGTYIFTPIEGATGTDSFTYTLRDYDGNATTATINLNVMTSNLVPVAGVMDEIVDVETGESFSFTANFSDADSTLSYFAVRSDGAPLPDGLSIDTNTGVLSGVIPNVPENIEIRVGATDGVSTVTHTLLLVVSMVGTQNRDYLHGTDNSNNIFGEDGDDILYGYEDEDFLYGDNGNDYIYGHEGADYIDGGQGADVLFGLEDNDYIVGGQGNDFLYGDDQDGLGTFIDGGNDTLYGGDGDDKLVGGNGNDALHGGANGDTLFGNDGQDTLNGDNGDDFLYGGDGIDTLQGGAGRDRLAGDQGDDTLHGGDDRDTLFGGDGDDVIRGGTSIDSLYGNDGADTFVYQQGDVDGSRDYILDFSIAQGDTIDISDVIDFSSANGDDITDFVLLGGGSSYVRINIDQDGSGNAHSVQAVAQITNNTGWDLSTLITNGTLIVE